jgi:hypothetical protein
LHRSGLTPLHFLFAKRNKDLCIDVLHDTGYRFLPKPRFLSERFGKFIGSLNAHKKEHNLALKHAALVDAEGIFRH